MMFMHISPEYLSRGETLSTLNFGFRVSQITLGQVTRLFLSFLDGFVSGDKECREGVFS